MASLYRHILPPNPLDVAMRAARGKLGPEDTLTALVAHTLAENPALAREWALFLLSKTEAQLELFEDIPIEVSLQPYSGNDQPDMAITLGNRARIVFEHKLDSPEGANQLERYIELCASERRATGITHYLAFVAPSPHNLLASHYIDSRFIAFEGRHPLWSNLGAIIEERAAANPSLKPLHELFDSLYLLPYEIPTELEPLLMDASTVDELPMEALKARRGFNMLIRNSGKAFIDKGWKFSTSRQRQCYFEPPDNLRPQHPLLRWIVFDIWSNRRIIGGIRMPAPALSASINFVESRENNPSREIDGLMNRFRGHEVCGYSPKIASNIWRSAMGKTRAFHLFFDLNEIWRNGDLERFATELVPLIIELFDPPIGKE